MSEDFTYQVPIPVQPLGSTSNLGKWWSFTRCRRQTVRCYVVYIARKALCRPENEKGNIPFSALFESVSP